MKKMVKIIFALLFVVFLSGCSEVILKEANLSDGEQTMLINPLNPKTNLNADELYKLLKEKDNKTVFNMVLEYLVNKKIDLENEEVKEWYHNRVNNKMLDLIDGGAYSVDSKFNEELFVKYLKSELYDIDCNTSNDYLDQNYFTCNYQNYINSKIKYELYEELLLIDYVLEKKPSIIDNNNIRKVTYLEIYKDNTKEEYQTYNKLLQSVEKLISGEIVSLKQIEEEFKNEEKQNLEEEYQKYVNPNFTDPNFSGTTYYAAFEKFTNCGDYKCTPEEGKQYLLDKIDEKAYLKTKILTKKDDDVFNEPIRERLFTKNVEEKLYKINDSYFLTIPSDVDVKEEYDEVEIILSCVTRLYLIDTKVIKSTSESLIDKYDAILKVKDSVKTTNVYAFYLEDYKLEIYDEIIEEYINDFYK